VHFAGCRMSPTNESMSLYFVPYLTMEAQAVLNRNNLIKKENEKVRHVSVCYSRSVFTKLRNI
jgi:hypothetical protein